MEVFTLTVGAARRNNLPCGLGLVVIEVLGREGVHAVVDHLEQGHVLELVLGGVLHVDVVAYQQLEEALAVLPNAQEFLRVELKHTSG